MSSSPRIPPNLRINADDFGLRPEISRAIVHAAREGLINSFSVVPFEDTMSERWLAEAKSIPGIRIGAHLTFAEVPLLTRPSPFFDGQPPADYLGFLRLWLRRKITSEMVRAEWSAQLERLRRRLASMPIHHLDSHQHLHVLPGLWQTAVQLQKSHGVPVLRRPLERSWLAWRKDFPLGAGLQTLALLQNAGTSEIFFGVGTSMAFQVEAYRPLAEMVRAHPERRFELMVHPSEDPRGERELSELHRFVESL